MHRDRPASHYVLLCSFIGSLALAGATTAVEGATPVFPGAEGFGTMTPGGRGGRVIEVTSLDDKIANPPEGTLRYALEQPGKRIIVFKLGGTIEPLGKMQITQPFVTVAGQTAPGGGITIRGTQVEIETHDVLLRGLRFRPGPTDLPVTDALVIKDDSFNVVVDHCSMSWSTDEVVDIHGGAHDVTIHGSIVSEGLDCSTHPEGCHSRGMLINDGAFNITLHHNLFAHNDYRNARLYGDPQQLDGIATFDFFNNVVYDWNEWGSSGAGDARVNIQANYYKLGPSSRTYPDNLEIILQDETPSLQVWVQGNVGPSCPAGCPGDDDWEEMVTHWLGKQEYRASGRNPAPQATITEAEDALLWVLDQAGASYRIDEVGLRRRRKDLVDRRIVRDVRQGVGEIIDDPAEVGGWPLLEEGVAPVDLDHDGMPDTWELTHGFDPLDASDGAGDGDGDVYTNVEEYLNETDPAAADS